jgi:hypothetical protein
MSSTPQTVNPIIERRTDINPSLGESEDCFRNHLSELQRDYGGRWVAMSGSHVVCVGNDLADVHQKLDGNSKSDALLIDYVPRLGELMDLK